MMTGASDGARLERSGSIPRRWGKLRGAVGYTICWGLDWSFPSERSA